MSALHGSNVVLLFDGFNMTGYFREFSMEASQTVHDTTVFGQSSRTKIPGLKDGKASGAAFFDPTATVGSYPVLKGKFTGSSPASPSIANITMGLNGLAVGGRTQMGYFNTANLTFQNVVDGLEMMSLATEAEEDSIDHGISLHALSEETSFPFSGTAVDNTAATANGGVGTVHITANAGASPSLTMIIQHSTDNSTWVTLLTFLTNGSTAHSSDRVEVAAGTTVRRYLRLRLTEFGSTDGMTLQ